MKHVSIIPYRDEFAGAFKSINQDWLEQYGLMEPRDLEILDHPRETILDDGGAIFLAEAEGEIIGTAALMREHAGVFELVKMGVVSNYRGRGVSRLLLDACLHKARQHKARKLILFSNHQLVAALALYEKYGFRQVEVTGSPFETADVKMELVLPALSS